MASASSPRNPQEALQDLAWALDALLGRQERRQALARARDLLAYLGVALNLEPESMGGRMLRALEAQLAQLGTQTPVSPLAVQSLMAGLACLRGRLFPDEQSGLCPDPEMVLAVLEKSAAARETPDAAPVPVDVPLPGRREALESLERVGRALSGLRTAQGCPECLAVLEKELGTLEGAALQSGWDRLAGMAREGRQLAMRGANREQGLEALYDVYLQGLQWVEGLCDHGSARSDRDVPACARPVEPQRSDPPAILRRLDRLLLLVEQLREQQYNLVELQKRLDLETESRGRGMAGKLSQVESGLLGLLNQLQEAVLDARLGSMGTRLAALAQFAQAAAAERGRLVDVHWQGREVEIDREVWQRLEPVARSLVSAAVGDDLENPRQRLANHKARRGRLWLRALDRQEHVVVEIEDDGRGLDPAVVRTRAVAAGLGSPRELAEMEPAALWRLLADPAFARSLGDGQNSITPGENMQSALAGAAEAMINLSGNLQVESVPGEGTRVMLRVPRSLAVARVLVFSARGLVLGAPLDAVGRVVSLAGKVSLAAGQWRIQTEERRLALREVSDILPLAGIAPPRVAERPQGSAVLLRGPRGWVALRVDGLHRLDQVLVKGLGPYLGRVPGLAGAAMGDDRKVILLLDPAQLDDGERAQGPGETPREAEAQA